jgi:hypothetical protein
MADLANVIAEDEVERRLEEDKEKKRPLEHFARGQGARKTCLFP